MDSENLVRFIQDNHIEARLVHLQVDTPTVSAAAEAVGVLPEQIGKSLLFLVDGQPILVIANGNTRVDYRALANYLGVNRKRIRLANPQQVLQHTGYSVGTVPPFGHSEKIRTLLERSVSEQDEIYVGGGDINALLQISLIELEKVIEAPRLDLKRNDLP